MYKGVEIALKYSESWGYHMELEIMIASKDDLAGAESQLKSVAEDLGVKIMSPEEQTVFAENIDMQYKKNTKV
jgi:adenylate cyclase class IV